MTAAIVRIGLKTAKALEPATGDVLEQALRHYVYYCNQVAQVPPDDPDMLVIYAPGWPSPIYSLQDDSQAQEYIKAAEDAGQGYVRAIDVARLPGKDDVPDISAAAQWRMGRGKHQGEEE